MRHDPVAAVSRGSGAAEPPHVLYVAWGFPPHRGPGTYRPLASVNALVGRGTRVTVLTADRDTFDVVVGADHSLTEAVDPRVRVVRVPMLADTRDPVVNRWPGERAADPRTWTRALAAELGASFPEPVYVPWLRRAASAALAVHRVDPVDLVIASGNPYVDFAVATLLHAEAGVPFILDDRDSWLLDVYTGEPRADLDAVLPWFEPALAACRAMWFVNPPIAAWHRSRFPWAAEKVDVVENGWDPLFLDMERLAQEAGRRPPGPAVLTFVGTVNPTLPLRAMAEAWRRARAVDPDASDGLLRVVGQLGHSAGSPTAGQMEVQDAFRDDGIVFTGRVRTRLITDVYASSDALLFAKEGGGMVTSGKVYEYVATGLPIVAALGEAHDAWRVLEGYPRLFRADPGDVAAVASAMVAALREGRSPGAAERRVSAARVGAEHRRDRALLRAFDEWGAVLR